MTLSTKHGVFASIDVWHTLSLGFIDTGRTIASRAIECNPESRHNFLLLDEGYVVVTSCSSNSSGDDVPYTTLTVFDLRAETVSHETIQGEIVDVVDISTATNTLFCVLFADGRIMFFVTILNIIKETYENTSGRIIGRAKKGFEQVLTVTTENKIHTISPF